MDAASGTEGPVNLGNPQEFTIAELARLIVELSGSSSRVVHRPLPSDDPRQRRPDITRARQLLDWRPTVGLREGLLRTIAYFENDLIERPPILRPLEDPLQTYAAE
jgi:UDP-glucuronate decarboxylase